METSRSKFISERLVQARANNVYNIIYTVRHESRVYLPSNFNYKIAKARFIKFIIRPISSARFDREQRWVGKMIGTGIEIENFNGTNHALLDEIVIVRDRPARLNSISPKRNDNDDERN